MPIEKRITGDDYPEGGVDVEVSAQEMLEELPEIEIEFDTKTGEVVVNIGDQEDADVPFDANLAEVVDTDVLTLISSDLMLLFEADKSSRKDWEDQYSKGMKLLGFSMEERTKPFKGASGVSHPLLTESIVQFQAIDAFRRSRAHASAGQGDAGKDNAGRSRARFHELPDHFGDGRVHA